MNFADYYFCLFHIIAYFYALTWSMKKKFRLDKNVLLFTAFYLFPFFVLAILGIFLISELKVYLKEVVQFGFFTAILFSISQLINHKKVKSVFYRFSMVLLSVLVFIKLAFYYNFNAQLSASAFYLLFETNGKETSEFLDFYINAQLIILLLVLSFMAILFVIKTKINFLYSFSVGKKTGFLIFATFLSSLIFWKLSDENILLKTVSSYNEYKAFKKIFEDDLAKEKSDFITNASAKNSNQTYVVIIGESTSKTHMHIYGYGRKTTPNLDKIKDSLLVFTNVITPHTHTITALNKILTLKSLANPDKKDNASLVQLANNAGFYTFWISNQRPVGMYESIPSLIGKAANETIFTNTKDYGNIVHDSRIFPKLKKALNDSHKKKIIFIHLMGTHSGYKNRYPKEFNVFTDSKNIKTVNNSSLAINRINQYDNANLYNDYIVSEIIKRVKNKNTNSYVLYFSDHGDEVYDTLDFCGHNEWRGTKSMHEVPFILWLSKKYKLENTNTKGWKNYTNRSYLLDDFIHSFAELSSIKFSELDTVKSIFNTNFKPKKRILANGRNYDEKKK